MHIYLSACYLLLVVDGFRSGLLPPLTLKPRQRVAGSDRFPFETVTTLEPLPGGKRGSRCTARMGRHLDPGSCATCYAPRPEVRGSHR